MVRDTPLLRHTTQIRYRHGDERYSATGFFLRNEDGEDYLVTAKHVVEHEHRISPDRLTYFVRDGDNPENRELISTGIEYQGEEYLTHTDYPEADITALPLEEDLDETGSSPIRSQRILENSNGMILAGGNAMVLGYPMDIREQSTSYPIIRRAMISTPFNQDFNGEPCLLIDGTMHPGMSGSPLMTSPSEVFLSTQGDDKGELVVWRDDSNDIMSVLLGIHSGPFDRDRDLGLHKVWRANLLLDII